MEKNIHNDPMDDYVRKSFNDFEENPADDMWNRIEGELAESPAPETLPLTWQRYRWQAVAATVILLLLSRLMCVQYYYEEKLRDLSAQQEKAQPQAKNSLPIAEQPSPSAPNTIQQAAEQSPVAQAQLSTNNPNAFAHKPQSTGSILRSTAAAKPQPNIPAPSGTIPAPVSSDKQPDVITNNLTTNELPVVNQPTNASSISSLEKLEDFQTIGQKQPLLDFFNPTASPNTVPVRTKRFKEKSGWYVGLSATPHLIVEKSEKRPARPGPANPRHLFGSQQEKPQVAADLWLRVGKKINKQFAIESGIGFQRLVRTATHRPWFQYREGRPLQLPGQDTRSFDYDLNTYGGSATVSLRTEVNGSNTPTANEQVGAVITSKEEIQVLRIPLLGVARLGQHRTQLVLKAGVLGSYLLKNQFSIEDYTLDNNKLQFRNTEGYDVQFNRPKHFILGYQLAAGIEFRMSKNISLAVGPTLSGDFPRNDPQRGKLPNHTAVGLNVGANWWF